MNIVAGIANSLFQIQMILSHAVQEVAALVCFVTGAIMDAYVEFRFALDMQ